MFTDFRSDFKRNGFFQFLINELEFEVLAFYCYLEFCWAVVSGNLVQNSTNLTAFSKKSSAFIQNRKSI